jgi:hypothetical protein
MALDTGIGSLQRKRGRGATEQAQPNWSLSAAIDDARPMQAVTIEITDERRQWMKRCIGFQSRPEIGTRIEFK